MLCRHLVRAAKRWRHRDLYRRINAVRMMTGTSMIKQNQSNMKAVYTYLDLPILGRVPLIHASSPLRQFIDIGGGRGCGVRETVR